MKFFILLFLSASCCLHALDFIEEPYVIIGGGAVFPMRDSSVSGDSNAVLFRPTIPGTSLFKLTDVVWKNKYKPGFEANVAVGCLLCSGWNFGLEFLYQNIKRETRGSYTWNEIDVASTNIFASSQETLRHSTTRTNVYSLLTDLEYEFRGCSLWTFSIGGGVGVAWLQSNSTSRNDLLIVDIPTHVPPIVESSPTIEKSPTLYGTAFAWQMRLGLGYIIEENFTLNLNYRLFGTTRFHARTSSITTNPGTPDEVMFNIPQDEIRGLLNSSVNLSLTYDF